MQVVITDVPKSSCNLETVMVNSDLQKPKQCNCLMDKCKFKVANKTCSQMNKECQLERQIALKGIGIGNSSGLLERFQNLYRSIIDMEVQLESLVDIVEEKRVNNDLFETILKRAENRLLVAKQEKKLAKLSIDNEKVALGKDVCLYQHYLDYDQKLDYEIEKLNFETLLPLSNNLMMHAVGKQISSGYIKSVPFVYNFDNGNKAIEVSSKLIVYSTICGHLRNRRSIETNKDIPNDDLDFTSWDTRKNGTATEASCATFNIIIAYFGDLLEDLKELIKVESLYLSNSVNAPMNIESKSSMKLLLELDLNRGNSSVSYIFERWLENIETRTAGNNFTVCLSFEDCARTAFRTLSAMPVLPEDEKEKEKRTFWLFEFQKSWVKLFQLYDSRSLEEMSLVVNLAKKNLQNFNKTKWHCARLPRVTAHTISVHNISTGSNLQLSCGNVDSDLRVRYEWALNGELIDGENSPSLTLIASLENGGVYTCIVSSKAGESRSNGVLVNVFQPPSMISQPQNLTLIEGDYATGLVMLCEVAGFPRPKIAWYYKSFETFSLIQLNGEDGPELSFNMTNQRNSGMYHCQAKNDYGIIKSKEARFDILQKELPKQYVKMSVDLVVVKNETIVENVDKSFDEFPADFTAIFNFPQSQNITFSTTYYKYTRKLITLHFSTISKELSIGNKTMLDSMEVFKQNMKNLEISARKFLDWINLDHSVIKLRNSLAYKVDKRTATYVPSMNECQPGFQMHKNGIVCGKSFFFEIWEFVCFLGASSLD